MNLSRRLKALALVLLIGALVGCNVGVGMDFAIPAPWGYVSVGTGTSFPVNPGW